MKRACLAAIVLSAMVASCHGAAAPKGHQSLSQEIDSLLDIKPPLKDVASDKKFFGPPFPADYPEDKRPVIKKSIMDSMKKSPNQVYPSLQAKEDFDADFVKDENSDTGAWKAQFEYDAARKRLLDEEGDEKRAQTAADSAAKDEAAAQHDADGAAKEAGAAQKELDGAKAEETADEADDGDDHFDDGSATRAELQGKLQQAEDDYENAKKAFAECERQLEEAKAEFERLKVELAEMEKKAAAETKLFAEQKAVRMNALKVKKEGEMKVAAAKTKVAQEKFDKVHAAKVEVDKKLEKEKAQHEQALKRLKKEKASLDFAKSGLEDARGRLLKLRGHAPPWTAHKSGARTTTAVSVILLAAARCFL